MEKGVKFTAPAKEPQTVNYISFARRFQQAWLCWTDKACAWLNRKTAHSTPRQATIALIVFCGAFVSTSILVTVGALHQPSNYPRAVVQLEKRIPTLPGMTQRQPARMVSDLMDRHRTALQRWLDSLAHDDTVMYRQIIGSHPTLLSQLQWLDSIHQNQNDSICKRITSH